MSKTKKLSLEEKRTRVLEIFHETKDVFLLKDVEKIASKEKGIPVQTVKDVLTSLVDDELVDSDKIGTSVYFWSFPSKQYNNKSQEKEKLSKVLLELQQKNDELDKEIEMLSENSDQNETKINERIKVQEKISNLEAENEQLKRKLNELKAIDPENFEMLKNETKSSREAVDRWTDNLFAIISWCKKKFQMDESEIKKNLGIPLDLDYFED